MGSIEVQATEAMAEVEARPGDTVTIRLPENPTTGYSWELPGGYEVAANEFSGQGGSGAGAGAGGERVVTLIVGKTPATAEFRLVRSWGNAEPERSFTLVLAPPA